MLVSATSRGAQGLEGGDFSSRIVAVTHRLMNLAETARTLSVITTLDSHSRLA